jgi:protein-S-isoprenylcysteine O-methyltransferase Ste14
MIIPLFIRPHTGMSIISDKACSSFFIIGLLISSLSVVELWTSFGIIPALRDIVRTGPYTIVRHPIYLGYLISISSFCLANFSLRNILILTFFVLFTILRMKREEQFLWGNDSIFKDYSNEVKHRIIPWVY